ncbi:hypothetical protein PC2016_1586 [Pseudoalteromonas carrageenovora]|mgnify:FL=1|jgi:hypothetical protein|uniref:Metal-binding protein n=2 Tax=Pseudoalteromonas TaxID=53246 RepID=A0A2K4X9D3_PSEVC|nr:MULTISPECIES: DUF411 domain-containing protein [Gammaproteobacteria]MDC9523262.1 DUF411 domain-containing protein [Pseudoalteromonas sp. Angola-31]HBW96802.1 metal-binding protein [Pseudoalteromonas sp.]ETJ47820.1 metal-binding protein [Pseudoalteromonas agarivorans]EWH05294.1 metal-binding protein [Pseudoalteromonas lipolytica SCSIO 04301]KPW02319.1 hypothetical protein AN390_01698 [Pseudoalteromonas sp. P1-11]
MRVIYITSALFLSLTMSFSAISIEKQHKALITYENSEKPKIELTVYKSKNCGCCNKWIAHLSENNIQTKAINVNDMGTIKSQYQIKSNMRSCHTAVSADGFVFEGHVPAKHIKQFLAEQHPEKTIGLSVPAMPAGTPGMEMGDRFYKYNIEMLTHDLQQNTYKHISKYAEQF